MKTMNNASEFVEMWVNNVDAETEKAYKLNIVVSWNGNTHDRSFWFPKSVVKAVENGMWEVKTWFANKMEKENAFKGYAMRIEAGFAMIG